MTGFAIVSADSATGPDLAGGFLAAACAAGTGGRMLGCLIADWCE